MRNELSLIAALMLASPALSLAAEPAATAPQHAVEIQKKRDRSKAEEARARDEALQAEIAAAKRVQEARDAELLGAAPRPIAPGVRPGEADYRALAGHADLVYDRPVTRSEEGMPIGTGSMGSLVWTMPRAIKLQVNRVDVFAFNRDSVMPHPDYCNGCAYVDINLADIGDELFAKPAFRQRLSVYDGEVSVHGNGVSARVVASQQQDVFAVEVDNRRERPAAVSVDLRMLRAALVRTGGHTATSRLDIRNGRIVLTQEFRVGGFCCASAVAAGIAGRAAQALYASENTVRLTAAPGTGKFTVLLASAAIFDPKVDVAGAALAQLDAAGADYAAIHAANEAFWQDFWSRAFVRLSSVDGRAEFVEQNYTYFLYLMASSSRGKFPPKFNGMLWVTTGDVRTWGSLYWWDNTSPYCRPLPASNRPELLEPFFRMYTGMAGSCALAARQQWGSQGLYIPTTVCFDGLAELPEEIAAEMRELYLLHKPWEQRSRRFLEFATTGRGFEPRWNWMAPLPHHGYIEYLRTQAGCGADYPKYRTAARTDDGYSFTDVGFGPFGHVTHAFNNEGELAHLYWKHFEHTQDRQWLRDTAYPMLKGVVEFFRNYPNMQKGEDGRYHLRGLTRGETFTVKYQGIAALRTVPPFFHSENVLSAAGLTLAGLRTVTPILIRAAELLNADPELLPVWRDFNEHLPPLPVNPAARAELLEKATGALSNYLPLMNVALYDFCYVETEDRELVKLANAAFDNAYPNGSAEPGPDDSCTRHAIAAAHLGCADDFRNVVINQLKVGRSAYDATGEGTLPNRLSWRSGPGAPDAEHLGFAAEALQESLLQSGPPAPGKDPIIHVFPAWPKDWDAEFTLGARGGFLVTSAMRGGRVAFVELRALAAGECRLRNPWGETPVTLHRNGKAASDLAGSLLRFQAALDEGLVVVPQGSNLESLKRNTAKD